jgi:hypothetical protein
MWPAALDSAGHLVSDRATVGKVDSGRADLVEQRGFFGAELQTGWEIGGELIEYAGAEDHRADGRERGQPRQC